MANDAFYTVGVTGDRKVKLLIVIHASLPQTARLIELLGVQGWVIEIPDEIMKLFEESLLNWLRRYCQRLNGALGKMRVHLDLGCLPERALDSLNFVR